MSDREQCPNCGHYHDSSMTIAVNRYNPNTPTKYRADHPGSTHRDTRTQAEQDLCNQWAER